MPAPALTPAALDQAVARLIAEPVLRPAEVEAWRGIATGYKRTAPASPARNLLHGKTVDELIREAGIVAHGTRPAVEVRLPGRIARSLPDWTHRRYRANVSHPPSVQLHVAATILREWGWQAQPHHLRDWRGRRCLCGAICAAVALGVGDHFTAHQAAAYVMTELHHRRWSGLIGEWNQQPGRTAEQAVDLVHAAQARALRAGQ